MNQEVTTREHTSAESRGSESSTPAQTGREEEGLVLIPTIDIFEDKHGITVQADMPGVAKDRLNVQADRNSLLIEGGLAIDMPAGMEALYADVQATKYQRSFVLSGELETDKIEANLKDGVLTVRIPKRAEFRPRKIEVRAG
jgi:HSP20 family molecular chaperone IbpA